MAYATIDNSVSGDQRGEAIFSFTFHVLFIIAYLVGLCWGLHYHIHSEKSPARPMLFYSTNYWQQF